MNMLRSSTIYLLWHYVVSLHQRGFLVNIFIITEWSRNFTT